MLSGSYTLGQVDAYQQVKPYSCSCASLLAVLRHYNLDNGMSEDDLVPLVGLTPLGAWPYNIVQGAGKLGLPAFEMTFTPALAQHFTDQGIPVIAEVESWNRPGSGHFVVLCSLNPSAVQIMDPNTPGNWRTITQAELAQRWAFRGWRGVVVLPR